MSVSDFPQAGEGGRDLEQVPRRLELKRLRVASLSPPRWRLAVALRELPVLAEFLVTAVSREAEHQAARQRELAAVIEHGRPPLHRGEVALDDRTAEPHTDVALTLRPQ